VANETAEITAMPALRIGVPHQPCGFLCTVSVPCLRTIPLRTSLVCISLGMPGTPHLSIRMLRVWREGLYLVAFSHSCMDSCRVSDIVLDSTLCPSYAKVAPAGTTGNARTRLAAHVIVVKLIG
jgi:hypothetical protein